MKSVQDTDAVKLAVYGTSGHQLLGGLADLQRLRLTAVSGVDEAEFEALKEGSPETVGQASYFSSLDALLADGEFDLISLCSRRRADQADQAIRALKAGKHVLAEKPMACSLEKLEELRRAARDSGKELRTMNPMIYFPQVWGVKEVVDSGAIGEIVQVYTMKSYPYRDARPQDESVDGGLTMQAGIHAVSFVRFVTGLEFVDVFCRETRCGNPKDGDLRMASTLAARMDNGALCSILCNYCNPRGIGYHGNDQLRILGTRGMVELVDGFRRRMVATHDSSPREFPLGTPSHRFPQDLIDCILDGTPTLLTSEDSFRNTAVVLTAKESVRTGQIVAL